MPSNVQTTVKGLQQRSFVEDAHAGYYTHSIHNLLCSSLWQRKQQHISTLHGSKWMRFSLSKEH